MKHGFLAIMVLLPGTILGHADSFSESILPLLEEYCLTCHDTKSQKGDLDLERFTSLDAIKKEPAVWEKVISQLTDGEMPPKEKPQLTVEQKQHLTAWVETTLREVALANAGDPGPVVLRRLSNHEYTYTIRDLTGVASLDPAKEFPVDGAAGEGFTNVGSALVMSPALLTKYLDAAKDVAGHAVLTPRGIHFSPSTSPQDWTDETIARIRAFYREYTIGGNATSVNLQGVKFDTNDGGRLPLEFYVSAIQGQRASDGLNGKYLERLRQSLTDTKPSLLLDPLRAKYREGKLTVADIEAWQRALWRFASVGHIGKQNGPKAWHEPVNPIVSEQEIRIKLNQPPQGDALTLYLVASDAGDGNESDFVLWENPRFITANRPDLPLREARATFDRLAFQRKQAMTGVSRYLTAAHEAHQQGKSPDLGELARRHDINPTMLASWLAFLGLDSSGQVNLDSLIKGKSEGEAAFPFIKGWTGEEALSVLANPSDMTVQIPGTMKPHSIATHPSPTRASVIAWRSPVAGLCRISGDVQDAHTACGNGVAWSIEIRRGQKHELIAEGTTQGATPATFGPFDKIRVEKGEVIALVIAPHEGSHICDLTSVNLAITDGKSEWDLAKDVSPDILAGNPHADRWGNKEVWYFLSQAAEAKASPAIPPGSLLAMWKQSTDPAEKDRFATDLQNLLLNGPANLPKDAPDHVLYEQLLSTQGPLLSVAGQSTDLPSETEAAASSYGIDPNLWGKHPDGSSIDATSLCVKAPSVIEIKIPTAFVGETEFVVTGKLHASAGKEGSVQLQVLPTKPESMRGITATTAETTLKAGQWSDNNLSTRHNTPIIAHDGSVARERFEAAFDEFRELFPIALCYPKIVPVDEVVTLMLFHREDEHLKRLMLDDSQIAVIDQLWEELIHVSEAPLKQVDVFEQLYQFATQDANPSAFEPMREPILRGAEAFRANLVAVEPIHVKAALDFATLAWRRPLTSDEESELKSLYQKLRAQQLPHASAIRQVLARILVAPAFLYRGEETKPGNKATPVNDWELATRLSYFLWSSTPDAELRSMAATGTLHDPAVLKNQMQRMLKDPRARRLATEFGCQWLHVRDIATLNEKSERHFPTFLSLREAMQEETTRFFLDFFQEDRSILSLLDADHTFLNGPLATHYGMALESPDWQRVDGLKAKGRGGILGFASVLSKQSGASRTSPILRGNWLSEVVLGEKLPRPPKGVPLLPDEAPAGLTERQMIERHSSDPACARCHEKIDPFGFALEGFDAIGRTRTGNDVAARLADGTEFEGISGLRSYLLETRRDDFLRQFCRKLLGYALGRSVQLSDLPLLEKMLTTLSANEYRISVAMELIVQSPQFRETRGRDFPPNE